MTTDPYVTFDTLTVGAEYEAAMRSSVATPTSPPVVARLPRVAPERSPKPIQRVDEPEPQAPAFHLGDPPESASLSASESIVGATTIRFDTGASPTGDAVVAPAPATPIDTRLQPAAAPATETASEAWGGWLLNLEATVQPYSRWIALAAVIAALGLTAVLLRGADRQVVSPEGAPQVDIGPTSGSLVEVAPADWATTPPDGPIAETTLAGSPPPPSSSGPVSAYPSTPRPELTTPIGPAAEVAGASADTSQLR